MKHIRPISAALVTAAVGLGAVMAAGPASAAPVGAPLRGPVISSVTTYAAPTTRPQLWRSNIVKYGMRDSSPTAISHVYEVQIRLQRSGYYRGPITGYFGRDTEAAVKAFQKARGLVQNGMVETRTWSALITYSRQRSPGWYALPKTCLAAGWHSCYSRSTYELFTFYNGTLWNTWLVRGGARGLETVTGTYKVYWQDVDHRSAAFDNAPMPYAQFFYGGEAIHASYTMVDPRVQHSHGCINMYIQDAIELWRLTSGRTHTVTVYGAWK